MSNYPEIKPDRPVVSVEMVTALSPGDMDDLCDATDAAIKDGGGFGWVKLPAREILESYWQGVITVPSRSLYVARLDGAICGTAQLVAPPKNNEAQSFAVTMTTNFVAPWARKYGIARLLIEGVEQAAREEGFSVINLDVRETQTAAIALYESMGYVCYGTHPFYAKVENEIIKGRCYYKTITPEIP